MSLKDAVEEIVNEMEEEIKQLKGWKGCIDYPENSLRGYMKQLKTALKAAGDECTSRPANTSPPSPNNFFDPRLITPEIQRASEVEKYRAEFKNKNAIKEEAIDGNMVQLLETPGEEDITYHPIDPSMPVGARTAIAGSIYQLRRRNERLVLVYDEVSTENAKKVKKENEGGIILG
jgi:hypothetical protein